MTEGQSDMEREQESSRARKWDRFMVIERRKDKVTEWQSEREREREREKYKDREKVNIYHEQVVVRLLNEPWTCIVLVLSTAEKNQRTSMGWLRWVGSLKSRSLLQNMVSLIGLFLQKRPIITNSLLIEATPHIACMCIYMCAYMYLSAYMYLWEWYF